MPQLHSLPPIRYEQALSDNPTRVADAVAGSYVFEYKAQIRDLRMLHAAILGLAQLVHSNPERRAILIIDETRISARRLEAEWGSYQGLFCPPVLERLSIAVFEEGTLSRTHGELNSEAQSLVEAVQSKLSSEHPVQKRRSPDSFLDVFRVILLHWFRRAGPLQLKELGRLTGFSYPTVAIALEKMEPHLLRHSDRSVELREFPREIWRKLLADSATVRAPIALAAQRPRPLEVLMENLVTYNKVEVGIGGIIGTRHYLPGIDLVGTHRLDLTIRDTSVERIQGLVRRIDPALKPVESSEAPQVVIHRLFRPKTFFQSTEQGRVADETECLLDLHEARLEMQANELLEHLIERARG